VANIDKRGKKWRAEVCIDRKRKAKTFPTKKEAVAWANEQEAHGLLEGHTLADAIKKYRPIAEGHKGSQSELSRLRQLEGSDLALLPLEYLTPAKIAQYRDNRLEQVAPVSVRRELIILGAILKTAKEEWGWLRSVPTETVKKPVAAPPRRRGVSQEEIDAICTELRTMRVGKQVEAMFRLSLETGMRLSEIAGLKWADVSEKYVILPETKNGDRRNVPLSQVARDIIEARKDMDPITVFTESASVASKTFERAKCAAGFPEVHFHDARSEAITRLSKKLDVMQLARMIGHRDLKSLMIYYAEPADAIADRL
jgi:integrase